MRDVAETKVRNDASDCRLLPIHWQIRASCRQIGTVDKRELSIKLGASVGGVVPSANLPSEGALPDSIRTSVGDEELLEPKLMDVAPPPFLTGLDRASDGMLRCTEVANGVLVPGRVAAADVAALHAHPELQPGVAQPDALITTSAARLHVAKVFDVPTNHWVFGQDHDDEKVRTLCSTSNRMMSCGQCAESIQHKVKGDRAALLAALLDDRSPDGQGTSCALLQGFLRCANVRGSSIGQRIEFASG